MNNEKWRLLKVGDVVTWGVRDSGVISSIVNDYAIIRQSATTKVGGKWYNDTIILAEWGEVVALPSIVSVQWRSKITLPVSEIPTPQVGSIIRFNVLSNSKQGRVLSISPLAEYGNLRDCVYTVQVQTGRMLVYSVPHSDIVPEQITERRSASAMGVSGAPVGQRGVMSAPYQIRGCTPDKEHGGGL